MVFIIIIIIIGGGSSSSSSSSSSSGSILAHLFIHNQLYMFRAISSPEICRAD